MKKPIKIALSGATGRMGKAVRQVVKENRDLFLITGEFSKTHKSILLWDKRQIQAVVDFSLPPAFTEVLNWCEKNKKVFVSGTTGLSSVQKRKLRTAGKKTRIFYEENMSWGIWQIQKWLSAFSSPVSYDFFLEDIHRKQKKDKPSGTALKLKKSLPAQMQKKIKIKSLRRGDEFGTHRLYIKGKWEEVILEHRALSRHLFAQGALKALIWLFKQKNPGLYSFEDLYRKIK